MPEFSAEPKRMFSSRIRYVVYPLERPVRRGEQRPAVIASQLIEAVHINFRHAKIDGRGHAGIDPIYGRGIRGVIRSQDCLPETNVAEASFVHPACIGNKVVAESKHLRSEFRLRFPFCAQDGDVELRL